MNIHRPRQHFVLFTKFKLPKLPKVKFMTSSKYWVLFCKIAAIKSTQYLKMPNKSPTGAFFAKLLQLKLPNI